MGTTNYRWIFRMVHEITIKKSLGRGARLIFLGSWLAIGILRFDFTKNLPTTLSVSLPHIAYLYGFGGCLIWGTEPHFCTVVQKKSRKNTSRFAGEKDMGHDMGVIFKERLSGGFLLFTAVYEARQAPWNARPSMASLTTLWRQDSQVAKWYPYGKSLY